ncbi:MAG: ATP-binding cassette domain-containing protein [Eubacterium sp.]|nr:ATP-binding cassette domain-containing protein [Eubacterium sp.]
MSILSVEHLTHGFGDRAIFDDVSFRLLAGEHIGLVGANGEGKSTFMNIITGSLQPDEGKIEWAKNISVGYMDQHAVLKEGMSIRDVLASAFEPLFDMEKRMNELFDKMGDATPEEMESYMEETGTIQDILTNRDFYLIDSKVEEVARALGLLDLGLDKDVTELSGGQRTKILLGKLLLEKPDILLLDEPTNYLDEEHIAWLTRYLQDYENAFILISHDIPFLNSVINIIYHMDGQYHSLDRYVGDYDKFQEVYAMKKAQREAAYNRQQQEIAELKDFVARNKARVATRNMAMSRQKKLDNMDIIEKIYDKPKPEFNFKTAVTPSKVLFETRNLVIGYDKPLSSPLNLSMERGERIVLVGSNGIGKTTLLKSILGLIPSINGQVELGENLAIGYFEQEMPKDIETTCLQEIWNEFPGFSQYEVRSALAKCGLTTKHIESKCRVLSGGEQAKVRLCKLINRQSNLLVLDEPTNHLDADAKDELKRALKEYKGSILMVCHEPEFYEDIKTQIWDCTQWTTVTV